MTDVEVTLKYQKDGREYTHTFPRALEASVEYDIDCDHVVSDWRPNEVVSFKSAERMTVTFAVLRDEEGNYGSVKIQEIGASQNPLDKDFDTVVARRAGRGVEVYIGGRWRKVHD